MHKTDSKKMNILQLMYYFPIGGSQQLLIDTVKEFSTKDNINNFVVILSGIYDEELIKELKNINKINLKLFTPQEFKNKPELLFSLLKYVFKNKIQLIHSHDVCSKVIAILVKIFNPKIKLVHTVHETNLLAVFSKKHIWASRVFYDKHIAISKAVEEDCRFFSINKVETIYNGFDYKRFYSKVPTVNNNETLNIINVARVQLPKKGQDVLVKALNECKKRNIKFKCCFVGCKPEDEFEFNAYTDLDYLKNMVKELSLEENINFLGKRFDIPELLSQADLFILPSRNEGFGLAVLEAMAAGLPVIVSQNDGPAEYIKDGTNGLFFENENEIDLADKIQYLYENRQKMLELAQTGQEDAKKYDISVMCEKYLSLYENLITIGK